MNGNRNKILIIMFILFILFVVFVIFYEKENKVIDVNSYRVPYDVKEELNINDYKVLGIIKNEEEHDSFLKAYDLYDDDKYLNYDFNYVHVAIKYNSCGEEVLFNGTKKNNGKYELIFKDKLSCGSVCGEEITIFEIPIDKDVVDISKIDVVIKYDDSNQVNCNSEITYKKPVMYFYPEKDINITVMFEHKDNLKTTYPKYENGWNLFVKENGTLIDKNGREYYALYWDELINHVENFETGFYVKSEESIKFLEEKLFEMGLTDREANEFIMYWLPIMEHDGDNLVHFHFTDDRERQNKIYIDPPVDSLFRFSMEIKKVNKKVNIKEQKIEKFNRYGFSALEWGGTVIK